MIEPILESRFNYKNFPCVVLFMPMGFRCGYVGLPSTKSLDLSSISCCKGLTYEGKSLYAQNDKDICWIGFHCSRNNDGVDIEKLYEYYGNTARREIIDSMIDYYKMINEGNEFKTLDYVKNECMKIVDQLLKESEE